MSFELPSFQVPKVLILNPPSFSLRLGRKLEKLTRRISYIESIEKSVRKGFLVFVADADAAIITVTLFQTFPLSKLTWTTLCGWRLRERKRGTRKRWRIRRRR